LPQKATILTVDDDPLLRKGLRYELKKEGYAVISAGTGRKAVTLAAEAQPDLILLDVGLPDISGFEVCRLLREDERTASILIVMLTARKMKEQIVQGLLQCADDYITKPYEPEILLARVRAMLRRKIKLAPDEESSVLRRGELSINSETFEVFVDQQPVKLTKTEFGILLLLARRPGVVFSRQQIVDHVWSEEICISARVVDNQITNLRKKLGPVRERIESIYGLGYKFKG